MIRLRDTLALKDFMTDMSMMVSTWQTDEGVSPRPDVTTIDNNSNSIVNSTFPSQGSLKDYLDNAKSLGHEIDAIGNIQKAVYHYTHSINSTTNDETDALLDYDKVRLGSYGSLFEYYEDPSDTGLAQQHDHYHHNHHSNSNSNSNSSNDVYSTWTDTNTSDVIIDIHDNSDSDVNDDTWRTIHAATATATVTNTATIDSSATTATTEEKYSDANDDTTWMSSSPDINTMLNNDANNFDNNIDDGDDDGSGSGSGGNDGNDEGGFSFKTVSSDSSNKVTNISSYNNYDYDNDNDDDGGNDNDEVNVDDDDSDDGNDDDNDDDSIDKSDSTDDNGDNGEGSGDISVTYRIVHYDVDGDTNDDNN